MSSTRKTSRGTALAIHAAGLVVAIALSLPLRAVCEALMGSGWLTPAVWILGSIALGWYSAEVSHRIVTRLDAR